MNRFSETKRYVIGKKKDYDFYYCVEKNIGQNMTKIRNCHHFNICIDLKILMTLQFLSAKEIVTKDAEGKLISQH